MSRRHTTPRRAANVGMSLVELMVALAIGTVLLLGLVQVFAASRVAYATSEGMARVQENARFALEFLQRDLRMAGHFGCANDQAHWIKGDGELTSHLNIAATPMLDFRFSVVGYEANGTAPGSDVVIGSPSAGWTPALPAQIQSALNPQRGSDVVVLRFLAPEGVPVTGFSLVSGRTQVQFDGTRSGSLTVSDNNFNSPGLFAVADCAQVDLFAQRNGDPAITADSAVDFAGRYSPFPNGQAMLHRAEVLVYYVGTGASGEPALFRARADRTGAFPAALREELVEGIESIQLLYGLDETVNISQENLPLGRVGVYQTAQGVTAGSVAQWLRVGAVQLGVLARSPLPVGAVDPNAADTPRVLGVNFTRAPGATGDGRIRASYEVSVAMRNRLFGN